MRWPPSMLARTSKDEATTCSTLFRNRVSKQHFLLYGLKIRKTLPNDLARGAWNQAFDANPRSDTPKLEIRRHTSC
jgi:hypothetical protein